VTLAPAANRSADKISQERSRRFETFVTWYLRFNGYFTVPSFVVHAGDDPTRISDDVVGQYTEVDTLAVRLPYSREEAGIRIPTHDRLVDGADGKLDVVVAEVKSGNRAYPNASWQGADKVSNIEYILRFIGLYQDDSKVREVAAALQNQEEVSTAE